MLTYLRLVDLLEEIDGGDVLLLAPNALFRPSYWKNPSRKRSSRIPKNSSRAEVGIQIAGFHIVGDIYS